jgi:hypothetical protein
LGSAALRVPVPTFKQTKELEVVFRSYFEPFRALCSIKGTGPTFNRTKGWRLFSDHMLAGLLGSAALKVPVLLSNQTKEGGCFFRSYFWQVFSALCSIKGTSPTQPNQGAGGCFFYHILAGLFGLCSIKESVLLSARLRAGGCFRSYLAGLLGSAALKVPVPTFLGQELEIVFRSYFGNLFRAHSIKVLVHHSSQNQGAGGCFFRSYF